MMIYSQYGNFPKFIEEFEKQITLALLKNLKEKNPRATQGFLLLNKET
jgi:hypothetical protein